MWLSDTKWTPRKLAISFSFAGTIIFLVLLIPMMLIFSGEWKLQQQIDLFFLQQITLGSQDWVINFDGQPLQLFLQLPIGQISLRYYALLILIGVFSGYALSLFLSKSHYIASSIVDRLLIGIVVFGIIGARLFFVAFNWNQFEASPLNIVLGFSQGGLAIFGAILGAFIYVLLYTSRFKFNLFEFLDFLVPGLLLGQVIGRFGNFFNYESYGQATSVFWKMYVPNTANISTNINDRFFHPAFLYELIPNFILLILILYNYDKWTKKRAGIVFAIYAMGYGFVRLVTEFFRLDALRYQLPFNLNLFGFEIKQILVSQIMAILLIIFGFYTFMIRRRIIYLKKNMGELKI
jgi:phosphatidylglycerol---prolipoprotein diacylglyceryl transferase